MSPKVEDLREMQAEAIQALVLNAETLDRQGKRIAEYRESIGPSLIAVAGKIESAADKQVKAAKINSDSMQVVVTRMETQEERHREERKNDQERQDCRDERFFNAVEKLTIKVEENSKISLETSHQVTTLTQAVADQCKVNHDTLQKVQTLEISMAVAKAKWAIVGTVSGALSAAVVGLLFKILGAK